MVSMMLSLPANKAKATLLSPSATKVSRPATNLTFGAWLTRTLGRRDSDDDMPALEAIIDPPTYTGKKPELATSKGKAAHVSEDDDMPSFEPLDQPKPKNKGKQPAASSSAADKKPSTPAAGPSSNNSNTSSSTSAKQFASKKEVEEDDDDMPALEPFDRAKSSSDPDSARHAALDREPEFKRRMHMALSSLSVPPETIDHFREEEGEREADEFDPNDDLDDEESDHCPCYSCMLERMEDGPPGDASRAEARDSRLREIARRNGLLSPSTQLCRVRGRDSAHDYLLYSQVAGTLWPKTSHTSTDTMRRMTTSLTTTTTATLMILFTRIMTKRRMRKKTKMRTRRGRRMPGRQRMS